jgi:protein-tyrosine phosphatase
MLARFANVYKHLTMRRVQYLRGMKILMVCLGNICRSPLAEGILRYKAAAAGLDWQIDSAGTAGYHVGKQPHELSQKVALLNGVDISGQQCRQFEAGDLAAYDKIFVMDLENLAEVKRIGAAAQDETKVSLILDHLYPGQNKEVPDPWYGTEKDYHFVFEMLSGVCDKIIEDYK